VPRLNRVVWAGLLLTVGMGSLCSCSQEFSAKVVGVADGDTITVLRDRTQVRLRIDGIDCPESGQAFGSRAKGFTSELTFGKVVRVRPRNKDRYGRTIAEVVLPDGRDVNHELVRAGFAWWFPKYAPRDTELARLEAEAKGAKRGLWSDARPIPPWEWRNAKTTASSNETGTVIGNRQSHVYHAPKCPTGALLSAQNRIEFASAAAAQAAGYRAGRDCHR
jgi:micrococcal nuclease